MEALIDILFKSGHIWGGVAIAVLYFVILPRIDKLIARHTAFLDSTDAQVTKQTETAIVISECLGRLEKRQDEHMTICRNKGTVTA